MNQPDEFHGVGGAYVLDPKTGKRKQDQAPTLAPDDPEHPANIKTDPAPAPASEGE